MAIKHLSKNMIQGVKQLNVYNFLSGVRALKVKRSINISYFMSIRPLMSTLNLMSILHLMSQC